MARINREKSLDGVYYVPKHNKIIVLENTYLEQFFNTKTDELFTAYTSTVESSDIPRTERVMIKRKDEILDWVFLGKL